MRARSLLDFERRGNPECERAASSRHSRGELFSCRGCDKKWCSACAQRFGASYGPSDPTSGWTIAERGDPKYRVFTCPSCARQGRLDSAQPRTADALWLRHGRRANPVAKKRSANLVESARHERGAREVASTSIVIRGDEASFLEHGTGRETVLPDDFLVVHDVTGTILRKCDLYFLRNLGEVRDATRLTTEAAQAVRKWYGDGVSIEKFRVDLPSGAWQRVAKIDGIRYRREGDLAGPYEHPYDPPVVLFRSANTAAWRVVHPDGCIIDERGIVHPLPAAPPPLGGRAVTPKVSHSCRWRACEALRRSRACRGRASRSHRSVTGVGGRAKASSPSPSSHLPEISKP